MRKPNGFTLIELSVVLVILGLLVGGVIGGKSLIRASQVRSIGVDAAQYIAAVKSFQDRFQSLPGDFPAATATWGASSCNIMPGSSLVEICDGNGDGQIGLFYTPQEGYHAWRHLARAGLLPPPSSDNLTLAGWPMPVSKIKNAGSVFNYVGIKSGDTIMFDGNYGHVLFFGNRNSTIGNGIISVMEPAFSTQDAKKLDSKLDDGLPALGMIRGYMKNPSSFLNEYSCSNSTLASAGAAAQYDLTQSEESASCGLIFITGF